MISKRTKKQFASVSIFASAAAVIAVSADPVQAADECGTPVGGMVTCSGSSYPAPNGIGYTNTTGLTLTLDNPDLVAQRTSGGQGGVFVSGSAVNTGDIIVNALRFQSIQSAVLLTNGIGAVNQGTAGNAVIRMDTGTVTVNTNTLGNGLLASITNSAGTGNALITLNGGQVTNTGTGSGANAQNAGTGNAAVTMTGGSVQVSSGTALRAAITNAASAGTASVTLDAGTITGTGTGVLATTSGSGLAQVIVNGGSVSSGFYGAQANSAGGSGNASATMTNGGITAGASFAAYGLSALAGSGSAQASMGGGSITTNASLGHGVYAASTTGAAAASMTGGTLVTNGVQAMGVRANVTGAASSAAATVLFSGGSITTNGGSAAGLYAQTAGSGAAAIEMSGGTVIANGTDADGIYANATGTGAYNVSLTGGTVTGGSGTGAAIHGGAAAGGTITIGLDAIVNAGASGIALSQTGGAATITTTGTITGNMNLSAAGNVLNVTGGTIDGDVSGGGNSALNFDLGAGSFTYGAPYTIGAMASTTMTSGTAWLEGKLNTNTLAVNGGSLYVNGTATATGGALVAAGGRLLGTGTIFGDVTNAGTIAPGAGGIGTLTIVGNYAGNGGLLDIEAILAGDGSSTDLLVIEGDTSGDTNVRVTNVGGEGAQTAEGIRIVQVDGASDGAFSLVGDYVYEGEQAVVGGAYAYRLYQGSVSDPDDGDWYLRSELDNALLFQAGVPVYEAYPGVLQSFNQLGTLHQRLGNRSWTVVAQGADAISEEASVSPGVGIWGQIEGGYGEFDPQTSTTATDYDVSIWRLKAGVDTVLAENAGGQLIGGVALHYGTASSDVRSIFGDGSIDATGYGASGNLTWYGTGGFYADAQAQITGYDSDLFSDTAGVGLVEGNNGVGYALGIELGQRIPVSPEWALTPQAQLAWSSVEFDDFTDSFDAEVSLDSGDSLIGRLGLAVDRQTEWQAADGTTSRSHVYGIGNLYYDFEDGTSVDVAGTPVDSEVDALWGGLGLGGTYAWADDKYSLYGEALAKTSLDDFGDSYAVSGTVGFRVLW